MDCSEKPVADGVEQRQITQAVHDSFFSLFSLLFVPFRYDLESTFSVCDMTKQNPSLINLCELLIEQF